MREHTRPERRIDRGRSVLSLLMLLALVTLPVAGGLLVFVGAIFDGEGLADGLAGASGIACAPDGAQVYVAAWDDSSLTVFNVDPATGGLLHGRTFTDGEAGVDGLAEALGVAVSPDARHVYVASYGDDAVAIFRRMPQTGLPDQLHYRGMVRNGVDEVYWLRGASAVAVSADGREVFVTSWIDQSLLVFQRDAGLDRLRLVDVENQTTGAPALAGAAAVALSPDGQYAYVSCALTNSVVVFSRDATRDGVAFAGVVEDGVAGVDGLAGTRGVLVDSSGRFVYASGGADNAVAIFTRDTTTDDLVFVGRVKQGGTNLPGLGGARGLAELPAQSMLAVAGREESAVTLFTRNPVTGTLAPLQSFSDGVGGVVGLGGVAQLAFNPASGALYGASMDDGAVVVFDPVGLIFVDGFESGTTMNWTLASP